MLVVGARLGLAPVLDVARDPRWGRVEETYGEDPVLAESPWPERVCQSLTRRLAWAWRAEDGNHAIPCHLAELCNNPDTMVRSGAARGRSEEGRA